ncbi:MAG: hypothetical protein WCF78_03105 [archaeon]
MNAILKKEYNRTLKCLTEAEMVAKKLDKIDYEIKMGKRKLLNNTDALGKYAKYIKSKNIIN